MRKAVGEYNRYRSPEVKAEIVEVMEGAFLMRFSGGRLSMSCCLYDWFEDLIYELKAVLEGEAEISVNSFKMLEDGSYLVSFKLRS